MNLSFKQYRAIDLTIMAVLLAIAEAVVTFAETRWFPSQIIILSPTIAIVCIVMMRWSGYAVIHAAIGGCVFCLAMGDKATPQQFAIYCAGNCGILIALGLFKIFGKQKVKEKFLLSMAFVFAAYCGAQLGRWAVGLMFGGSAEAIVSFFVRDCVSLLFAAIVVMISRRMDGLFEDQRTYLLRVNEEQRKEREQQEKENNWF